MIDIKKVVKNHNMTMKQVAEGVGVTQQAISQMLTGKVSLERLKDIARVVGCSVSELVADTDEEVQEPSTTIVCPHCGKELKIVKADD